MVKPDELIKLPQDNVKVNQGAKSTKDEFEKFSELVNSTLNKN